MSCLISFFFLVLNVSCCVNQYDLILNFLDVLELLPQPTVAHITTLTQ